MKRILEYAAERLNPVLVKEVRQALRGKQFKISFWFTVTAATLIGIFVMLSSQLSGDLEQLGRTFLISNFACLAAALILFVPVIAFFAMGAEWEENTYDLLVLSDLRPRRIIAGKLHSAGVQALLLLSAFGPFLAFSFLLQGVDLVGLVVSIGLCLAGSLAMSSFAICLSSLTSIRFARVVLLIALMVASVWAGGMLIFFAGVMQFESVLDLSQPEQQAGLTGVFLGLAVFAALAFSVACAQLSHAEENRSTGLRVLATIGLLAGLVWMAWMFAESGGDTDILIGFSGSLIGYAALCATFAATEDGPLGRRAALYVPRKRVLALLSVPFQPGGGRGVLLFLIHLALIAAGIVLSLVVAIPRSSFVDDGGWAMIVLALYASVYVLLPAGALASYSRTALGRVLVRVSVLLFVLIAAFVPAVLGFFLEDPTLMEFKHPGHPFWLMGEVWDGDKGWWVRGEVVVVAALALLALIVNAPRTLAGITEVARASRARAASERDAGASRGIADAVAGS